MGWLGQGEGNGKLSVEVSYHVVFGSQRGGGTKEVSADRLPGRGRQGASAACPSTVQDSRSRMKGTCACGA